MVDRKVGATSLYGAPMYVLEQLGFRKILDTTFMIGFLIAAEVKDSDTELYFKALRLAQIAIDLEPERYKHYFLNELPERYHGMVDVRTFGIGERLVFESYTRKMFERTHRWMVDWKFFPQEQSGNLGYDTAVL